MKMSGIQLPILINNATTGHKLQGSGVNEIFVHNWSYVKNWVYVILSRVKTKMGLYTRQKLSTDLTKYEVPITLQRMITSFKDRQPTYFSDDEYHEIILNSNARWI